MLHYIHFSNFVYKIPFTQIIGNRLIRAMQQQKKLNRK